MAPRKEKNGEKGTKAKHKRNTEEVQRFQKIRDAAKKIKYNKGSEFQNNNDIQSVLGGYNSHCQ